MSSPTSLNSQNRATRLNISCGSDVDNLSGSTVLDKYRLLNRLGAPSGEAAIYMATSPSAAENKTFVVKIYRRKDAVKHDVLEKLANLKSSGIVKIIDHGCYNGFPCIVMPYYKNGSLAGKTLSFEEIKNIVIPDVASGLKYLHENAIIHKDVKPANLMISDDGEHVHIIDFGISSTTDDGVSILITRTGMSPEYCAPETFNNVWLEESDYYSFGITLFELFKGHTPFDSSSDKAVLAASASIQKIPFSFDFPKELINLIKGLTYKDLSNRGDLNNPNRRWTCREIEKWINGEEVPVPGESDSSNDTFNAQTGISAYKFNSPYDFKNTRGQIVKLQSLPEFVEAFGTNWKEGKKHVGRGFASKFLIQQNMQSSASSVMDCEDAGVTDIGYAEMLIELSVASDCACLYWDSEKIDNMKILSDRLTAALFNNSSTLNKEYEDIKELLCTWFRKSGKTDELQIIGKLEQTEKLTEDIPSKVLSLCSFISPEMPIKIGDQIYQNFTEFKNFAEKLKNKNDKNYYEWLEQNKSDFDLYSKCFNSSLREYIESLTDDLNRELKRRDEEREHLRKNPVLNSAKDITEQIINDICNNYLESLTINYDFTTNKPQNITDEDWHQYRLNNNPLWQANCRKPLKRIEFKIILTENVHSLSFAFADFEQLEYVNISDTSNITDMSFMFQNAKKFNQPVGNWNTSKVTTTRRMFSNAKSFNQPISDWDVSNVKDMYNMFSGCPYKYKKPSNSWLTTFVNKFIGKK